MQVFLLGCYHGVSTFYWVSKGEIFKGVVIELVKKGSYNKPTLKPLVKYTDGSSEKTFVSKVGEKGSVQNLSHFCLGCSEFC